MWSWNVDGKRDFFFCYILMLVCYGIFHVATDKVTPTFAPFLAYFFLYSILLLTRKKMKK